MTWWLGPAINAIGSVAGANAKKKQAEAMTKRSPEEMEYVSKLKKFSRQGKYPVDQMMARASIPVQQQAMQAKAQTTGSLIRQGLESSIVARELMRKTDKDTMASLASQAREIAIRNEQSKADASKELYNYDQRRQELLRRASQMKSQSRLDMFKGLAGAAMSAVDARNALSAPQQIGDSILKDGKLITPDGNIIDLNKLNDAPPQGGKYDNMTFDEAMEAAKKDLGLDKFFMYKGERIKTRIYNDEVLR
tara:strand:- start:2416 stop:3165 length:750 start_codon:yes stop_codon:yes gene_type:complete